jgi:hypothetical protein
VQDSEGGGCDILHVDLNHILHACTHPSWREEAHVEEEAFLEVDLYLDRLVAISRPTQLVLVAMDGVAPSAKMAQQRGRRFYSAHLECQRRGIERQVRCPACGGRWSWKGAQYWRCVAGLPACTRPLPSWCFDWLLLAGPAGDGGRDGPSWGGRGYT